MVYKERLVLHILEPSTTRTNTGTGAPSSCIDSRVTGPVTAERQVDDNVLWTKFACNIAAGVNKRGKWFAPSASVDRACAVLDLSGNRSRVAWPEPDFDVGSCTLHCIPSTTIGVK